MRLKRKQFQTTHCIAAEAEKDAMLQGLGLPGTSILA